MKRTVKKNPTLEISDTKSVKKISAKSAKTEKSAMLKNKTVTTAEKSVKKAQTQASAKISAPAAKPKKNVSSKAIEPPKIVASKKKIAEETPVVKEAAVKTAQTKVSKTKTEKPVKTVVSKIEISSAAPKKSNPAKTQILPEAPAKRAKKVEKKAEVIIPAIKAKPKKEAKNASKTKNIESKIEKKSQLVATAKNLRSNKKPVEKKVEIVVSPIEVKPVKKKIKPIGSAVVRGKNGRYDFEVFPLDAEIKDGSAIYVISKRITDKSGRGHHKFVCIGQTESLIGEIKRHKKDKCVKQNKANVICLLREESETNRLKIETDLRQAHTIVCNQK